jgi:small conductance mechanosensitive channel
MEETSQEIVQQLLTVLSAWGLRVVGGIVLLVVGRMAAGAVRNLVRRRLEASGADAALVPFLSGIVYYLLLAAVLIAVLGLFGIQTASLIAVLGAAGLAVGLALQGTLSHFASGVMLLVFRPFRPGDYVEGGSTSGTVQQIGLFSTTLHTPDNVQVIVPNASIWGDVIKNYSANDTRRNDLVIGISYDDDVPRAVETIRRVLSEDSRVLAEPEPVVAVGGLGDSSVDLVVRPWCKKEDYWGLRFDLHERLKVELETAGCSIPYPQRDVHLHGAAAGSDA